MKLQNEKKDEVENDDLKMSLNEPLPEIIIDVEPYETESKIDFSKVTADNDENTVETDILDFIDVVKTISKDSDKNVLDTFQTISKSETKGILSLKTDPVQDLKSSQSVQEILVNPEKLQHLFKCMCHTCSYTSDNASEFKQHLNDQHANDKRKNRHGWLKCTYCLRKLSSPHTLVNHIIRDHGQFEHFQCPHCFHRDQSRWALLMHLQLAHPGAVQGVLNSTCLGDDEINPKLPPYSASLSKGLHCQESNCDKSFRNVQALSDHLYLDHGKPGSYLDFQCPYCLSTYESSARLVLHLKMSHRKKVCSVIVRRIEPTLSLEDISEDDSDHEMEIDEKNSDTNAKPEDANEGNFYRLHTTVKTARNMKSVLQATILYFEGIFKL